MSKRVITNIVGSTTKSDLAKLGLGFTLNMFEETTNANENYVQKVLRPIKGYKKVCDISGKCRGIFTCSNGYNGKPVTYAVFDNTLYVILSGNRIPYKIGDIAPGSMPVHFAETGNREGFHAHLVLVDGDFCYAVDTQIKPANQKEDFKTIQLPYTNYDEGITIHPTHIAYLYGFLVVNDKNTDSFYMSYQFPFERNDDNNNLDINIFQVGSAEWGYAGQSLQAYWAPDNTNALIANGSRLYTFGDRSYQMFQYTSDVNAPFNSPDTAAYPIGLKAIDSLAQLGATVVWLGSSDIGNNGIYVLQGGTQATRVSTPEIEREISKFKVVKDATAQIWQDNQHVFYCISFPSENVTYCYDLTEQSWSNRCSLNASNEKVVWRYNYATMNENGEIWQSYDGGIAMQTEEKWDEHDNKPILRLRRGGVMQSDYSTFFVNSIELMTNNGQYENLFGGAAYLDYHDDNRYSTVDPTEAKMMMRFSTDGSTWSDLETVDIGSVGDYDYDTIFYNFGMAKVFTIEFSCSDNIPFALYAIKIDADQCSF